MQPDCFSAIDQTPTITLKALIQRIIYYTISEFSLLRHNTNSQVPKNSCSNVFKELQRLRHMRRDNKEGDVGKMAGNTLGKRCSMPEKVHPSGLQLWVTHAGV